jgi:hypothetical protein
MAALLSVGPLLVRRVPGRAPGGGASVSVKPAASGWFVLAPVGSRRWIRHCCGSRSQECSAKPPRRQAVSVCSRTSKESRTGSLAVDVTTSLTCVRRSPATAWRIEACLRGLSPRAAGLSLIRRRQPRPKPPEHTRPTPEHPRPAGAPGPANPATGSRFTAGSAALVRAHARGLPVKGDSSDRPMHHLPRVDFRRQLRFCDAGHPRGCTLVGLCPIGF